MIKLGDKVFFAKNESLFECTMSNWVVRNAEVIHYDEESVVVKRDGWFCSWSEVHRRDACFLTISEAVKWIERQPCQKVLTDTKNHKIEVRP